MKLTDADKLMPLFIEKAYKMSDKHGVKLGENWLLDYNDIKDVIDNAEPVIPEEFKPLIDKMVELLPKILDDVLPVVIENLTSYEKRPQGEWHHSGECSVCHKRSYKTTPLGDIIGLDFTDFCKNCGADMRGEEDEQ